MEQYREAMDRFTKTYVSLVLYEAKGNVTEAARIAGLERTYLYRLAARSGIDPNEIRTACNEPQEAIT